MSHSEELTSVVKKILEKNNAKLKGLIGTAVQGISGEFLAVGLIDKEVDDSMRVLGTPDSTLAGTLLSKCNQTLLANPGEDFPKFIQVLKKHTILERLALEMESEFGQAARESYNVLVVTCLAIASPYKDSFTVCTFSCLLDKSVLLPFELEGHLFYISNIRKMCMLRPRIPQIVTYLL